MPLSNSFGDGRSNVIGKRSKAMLCYVTCCVMVMLRSLCYVMSFHVISCYDMPIMSCYDMLCYE